MLDFGPCVFLLPMKIISCDICYQGSRNKMSDKGFLLLGSPENSNLLGDRWN